MSTAKEMQLIWNDVAIDSRESDKYINATQMCKIFNKKFANWYETDTAKTLVDTLEEDLNREIDMSISQRIRAIDVKRGNSKRFAQGSWIHPHLAVQLAQWLSPKFAIVVSKWVFSLLTTGSVSIQSSDEKCIALEQELQKCKQELEEKNGTIYRLHILHREALSYKKNRLKEESIYIVSSTAYAKQGIFKVGRTKKPMSVRSSQHNTTHVKGDKIRVLREFKVGDSVAVERNIHAKLSGLLMDNEKEWFLVPFKYLEEIVQAIIEHDHDDSVMVNQIIDLVQELRVKVFDPSEWTRGIPEEFFKSDEAEEKKLEPTVVQVENKEDVLVSFDTKHFTPERRKQFVQECIDAYMRDNQQAAAAIYWSLFQKVLIRKLQVPPKEFKSMQWRNVVRDVAHEKSLPFIIKQLKTIAPAE